MLEIDTLAAKLFIVEHARAGETGAIYRAANWQELPSRGGITHTEYRRPDGVPVSERAALVSLGWRRELVPRKRRFVRGL